MATVLHVLQIIGIVLLIILAIVLFMLVFVLIAPLKYKFVLKYNAYANTNNICFIKLNWLCHIVKLKLNIAKEGMDYEFRLFGFKSKLLDKYLNGDDSEEDDMLDNNDEYKTDNKENNSSTNIEQEGFSNIDDNQDDSVEDNKNELIDDIEQIWEDLVEDTEYDAYNDYEAEDEGNKKKEKILKRIFKVNPIKKLFDIIVNLISTIIKIIKSIISTIKILIKRYEALMEVLEKKSTQVAIERLKKYLAKLCKHIKPKKTKIKINIGFEDPANTGYLLGAIGTIYGLIGKIVQVNPNFEDEECEIDAIISGRIRLGNLIIIAVRIIRDKAIKILLRNIKKLKEEFSSGRE